MTIRGLIKLYNYKTILLLCIYSPLFMDFSEFLKAKSMRYETTGDKERCIYGIIKQYGINWNK